MTNLSFPDGARRPDSGAGSGPGPSARHGVPARRRVLPLRRLVLPVLAGMARWVRQGPATAAAAIGAAAPLTGSVEQVAEDLAELRSLGVDQVFGSMVGTEPDAQLHALELLLAQEER